MSRMSTFSEQTAPIVCGKQTVRFAPECIAYVKAHGEFPENRDNLGDYLHMQFLLPNGAKTASWKEDQMERNPKFMDNIKLYYDGKDEGDGYRMKQTFLQMQKRSPKYKSFTMEQILGDLIDSGEFDVWFYRYYSKGRGYLQVAWTAEQYRNATHPQKKVQKPVLEEVTSEEALPFDLED